MQISALIPNFQAHAEEDDIDEPTVTESVAKGKTGSKTDDETVQRYVYCIYSLSPARVSRLFEWKRGRGQPGTAT